MKTAVACPELPPPGELRAVVICASRSEFIVWCSQQVPKLAQRGGEAICVTIPADVVRLYGRDLRGVEIVTLSYPTRYDEIMARIEARKLAVPHASGGPVRGGSMYLVGE